MNNSPDIYTSYFGLTERPFSLVPDPGFLFWSALHSKAFSILEYGILTRAPITLITGEVGAGKTTLLHHLLASVDEDVRIGLVANAHGDRGELLRWVLLALAQPASAQDTYVDLFGRFQQYLIDEYAAGRRVILIFDEAQNLSRESLEELRMFTNINSNKDELLQLVLVGQPELRAIVRRPDLTQFAQRVSAAFHLGPMDAGMVRGYIRHRLAVAGATKPLFSSAACDLIHAHTGGVPRLVNQLCDLSMVYAFGKGARRVSPLTVQQVLDDGVFFAARGRLDPAARGQSDHGQPDTAARGQPDTAARGQPDTAARGQPDRSLPDTAARGQHDRGQPDTAAPAPRDAGAPTPHPMVQPQPQPRPLPLARAAVFRTQG